MIKIFNKFSLGTADGSAPCGNRVSLVGSERVGRTDRDGRSGVPFSVHSALSWYTPTTSFAVSNRFRRVANPAHAMCEALLHRVFVYVEGLQIRRASPPSPERRIFLAHFTPCYATPRTGGKQGGPKYTARGRLEPLLECTWLS